ncbi:WW domain-binding protein 11-like [Phyllostomus hastatus]|uniref:WW domain-binding protein 11-like n=1 Tax=Phyllostomus hastatus TaxID=9423 RepID=UPI001E681BB7|nr:WW domain-binding protein 11-like [Phyllostomus hastatus]
MDQPPTPMSPGRFGKGPPLSQASAWPNGTPTARRHSPRIGVAPGISPRRKAAAPPGPPRCLPVAPGDKLAGSRSSRQALRGLGPSAPRGSRAGMSRRAPSGRPRRLDPTSGASSPAPEFREYFIG